MDRMDKRIFPCIICFEEFRSNSALMNHAWNRHSSENACGLCGGMFDDEQALKMHIDHKHRTVVRVLRNEDRAFSKKPEEKGNNSLRLEDRVAARSDDIDTGCSGEELNSTKGTVHCGTATSREQIMNKEDVNLDGKKLTAQMCHLCGVFFKNGPEWYSHQRHHVENLLFSCGECEKRFVTESALQRHLETHETSEPYQCHLCGVTLDSLPGLKVHNQTVHCNVGKSKYSCELCGKQCTSSQGLHYHRTLHYKEKDHVCTLCGLSFHFRPTLKRHTKEVHQKVKKFQCHHCHKTFSRKYHLESHERSVHAKIRDFPCSMCEDMSFFTDSARNLHMERKHGVKLKRRLRYCDKAPRKKPVKIAEFERVESSNEVSTGDVTEIVDDGREICITGIVEDCENIFYQCSACMKVIKTLGAMKRHVASHGEKPKL